MGAFSDKMTATALRLLTNYGQSVSVVRDNIASYTVATGAVSDSGDTSYSGYGYPEQYNSYLIDGVNVKQQDVKLTFSSTTQPAVNDIFTVGGVAYTAQNVERITAQGNNVVYVVQLRQ